MKLIKKINAGDIRAVVLDTPTHYIGMEVTSVLTGAVMSMYAYPHALWVPAGNLVSEEQGLEEQGVATSAPKA